MAKAIAALVIALAFSSAGAAAPRAHCNLNSGNCTGYKWGGLTNQRATLKGTTNVSAGAIGFVTDLSKAWVAHIQIDLVGEHCTVFPKPIPIALTNAYREYPVTGGHFSVTQTYTYPIATRAGIPGITSHLTGRLVGNRATGTVQWLLTGPHSDACQPSSGRFTWSATLRGKVGDA
jgi:hypothetical protein